MTAGEGDNLSCPNEYRGITRDGTIIYVEVSAAGFTYRNEPILILFLRDISERKQAEEVFLQSHRQLEQLNEAKTKAVNHISHELKTPLAVIQGTHGSSAGGWNTSPSMKRQGECSAPLKGAWRDSS